MSKNGRHVEGSLHPGAASAAQQPSTSTPGKRTQVEQSYGNDGAAVQRRATPESTDGDASSVQGWAERGLQGNSEALPHADRIQRAFGRHDVSGVRAHVGGPAASAAQAIGAEAYATGSSVAFARSPDLHTAAHEAAHVIQQRGGVQLKNGVGAAGDAYERHADEVADQVVRGQSAEHLLDRAPGGGGAPSSSVQRKETAVHAGGANKYKEGHLTKPAGWLYVAYFDDKKAHLVNGMNKLGTLDWAANNPGSVDYDWASAKPGAAAHAGASRSFEKDPKEAADGKAANLLHRLSVYPTEEEGRAAILDLLRVHGAKNPKATIEDVLVAFKGMEPNGEDVKGILRAELSKDEKDPTALNQKVADAYAQLTPEAKREKVHQNYMRLIAAVLGHKGASPAEIQALVKRPFSSVATGTPEYNQVIDAVTGAESGPNGGAPGIVYKYGVGLIRPAETTARSGEQKRLIEALFAVQADVEAELKAIIDDGSTVAPPQKDKPAAQKDKPPTPTQSPGEQPVVGPPALLPPTPAPPIELLPGAPPPGPIAEAAAVVQRATAWGEQLRSRGAALVDRIGTSDSPTQAQRDAWLSEEQSWRQTVAQLIEQLTAASRSEAVTALSELREKTGGPLSEFRTRLGG